MFDIGFWELLVIGTMALVILGPERLPGAIRSVVSTVRSVKQMANGFKEEVAAQLDAHELHTNLKKAEELGMQNLSKDLRDSVDELKAAAESVRQPYKTDNRKSDKENELVEQKVTKTSNENTLTNTIESEQIDKVDEEYSHSHGYDDLPNESAESQHYSPEVNSPENKFVEYQQTKEQAQSNSACASSEQADLPKQADFLEEQISDATAKIKAKSTRKNND